MAFSKSLDSCDLNNDNINPLFTWNAHGLDVMQRNVAITPQYGLTICAIRLTYLLIAIIGTGTDTCN